MNLCILEKRIKSCLQSDFISTNFDTVQFKPELDTKIRDIYSSCFDSRFYCPTINTDNNQVILKYDCDDRYVKLIVNEFSTSFLYGFLNKPATVGLLTDTKKQLEILRKFLYQSLNKAKMNEV